VGNGQKERTRRGAARNRTKLTQNIHMIAKPLQA